MKRITSILLSAALVLSLAGCGGKTEQTQKPMPAQTETAVPAAVIPAETPNEADSSGETQQADPESTAPSDTQSGALVVYFSRVGNTDFPNDIDAVSSATLSRSNGELKGNAQLMAEWMADEAGAEFGKHRAAICQRTSIN